MPAGLVEPRKVFRIAFSTDPQSPTPNYVDVTQWVRDSAVEIEYGRQHELGEIEPGRMTFELDNLDGRFDPTNTAGPYYPIYQYRRCQFLVEWPWLPGLLANPDFAAGATGWSAAPNTAIAPSTAQLFWLLSGSLALTAAGPGAVGAVSSTASMPAITPGLAYTGTARLRAGSTLRSASVSIAWYNAAKALLSTSAGVAVAEPAADWARPTVTAAAPAGAAFAQLQVSVAGAAAGEVHYLAAAVLAQGVDVGVQAQFTGFIDEFPTEWPSPQQAWSKVKAVDGLDLLNRKYLTSLRYEQAILADGPRAYYRLGEGPQSLRALDASANHFDGTYMGSPTLAAPGALPADINTAMQVAGNGMVDIPPAAAVTGAGAWSYELWFESSQHVGDGLFDLRGAPPGIGASQLRLEGGLSGTTFSVDQYPGATYTVINYTAGASLWDGKWHHIVWTRAADGKTHRLYLDGALVGTGATAAAVSVGPFIACRIAGNRDTGFEFSGSIDEFAIYPVELSAAQVLAHYNAGLGPGLNQTTGQRVGTLADVAGWSATDRAIDAGRTTLPGVTSSLATTFALAAMKDVERSEAGLLFVDPAGLLTFFARDRLMKPPYTTSLGVFVDSAPASPAEMPYQRGGLVRPFDTSDIRNEVVVTPIGGGSASQVATDSASVTRYGGVPRSLAVATLVANASENWDRANYELNRRKDGQPRVRSLRVRPMSDPANMFLQVLQRRLWDRVTAVRKTPPGGGPAWSQDGVIEGGHHSIRPGLWETTWALSPAETQSYWLWGTSRWGVDTRFAY
jgi:hypothetical protein